MLKKLIIPGFLIMLFNLGFSSDFSDYSFLLKVSGEVGFSYGPLITEEVTGFSFTVLYSDGTSQTGTPSVTPLCLNVSGEFLIKNFGIVLSYSHKWFYESASVGGDNDTSEDNETDNYQTYSYGGTLISVNGIYAGLNYHIPFVLGTGCGSFYLGVKVGYLSGTLYPWVTKVDFYSKNPTNNISESQSSDSLTGYSICPNIGVNFIFGNFNVGLGFNYYIDNYTASEDLSYFYYPDIAGTAFTVYSFTFEIFAGVAF